MTTFADAAGLAVLFVRPGMGTPVRLRLLAADGSEVRAIEL